MERAALFGLAKALQQFAFGRQRQGQDLLMDCLALGRQHHDMRASISRVRSPCDQPAIFQRLARPIDRHFIDQGRVC